jgi:glycosyltransferase involved in cell wall biosynthesis
MPVYNGERYLREAIESILNQTFEDFEFLVIDDGSSDGSVEIIQSYNDQRIRLILNETNLGLIATLNKGIDLARGDYIARMDCDDISMPERLDKQYEFMQKNPEAAVSGSWASTIDEQGEVTGEIRTLSSFDCISVELFFTNPMIHSSTFFKKNFIASIGSYNKDFERAEDYYLWIRVVQKKGRILNVPLFLLKYRNHTDNVSNIHSVRQEEVTLKAIQYAYKALINEKANINKIALIRNFYIYHKRIFGPIDKFKIVLILSHLNKVLKTRFINNQKAMNYLEDKINSMIDLQTDNNLKKMFIKHILLKYLF